MKRKDITVVLDRDEGDGALRMRVMAGTVECDMDELTNSERAYVGRMIADLSLLFMDNLRRSTNGKDLDKLSISLN